MSQKEEKAEQTMKNLLTRAANRMRMHSLAEGTAKSIVEKQFSTTLNRIITGAISSCEYCEGPMPVFVLNKDFFATTCSEKCKENLQLKKLICKKEEIKREIIDLESSVRKTLLDESANATISNHPADQSKLPNYNLDHILPTKRKLLIQYESAIEMHKAGTYGICEDCGEDIDPARLEVSPCASRCFNCKTELEEKGKISCGCGTKVPANRLRNSVCL